MPIYEYKCPNGHLFETFHGMMEASPEVCEVCGAGPLQRVLHPVAVHYKGSGFYSTDYGRKSKQPSKDSGGSDGSSSSSSESSGSSDSGSGSGSSDSGNSGSSGSSEGGSGGSGGSKESGGDGKKAAEA